MQGSFLMTPDQGEALLRECEASVMDSAGDRQSAVVETWNCSTVDALLRLAAEKKEGIGILNFASAKNPGGGFINGAMAQEESAPPDGRYGWGERNGGAPPGAGQTRSGHCPAAGPDGAWVASAFGMAS